MSELDVLREQLKPIFCDVYDPDSATEGNVQAALDKAMPLIAGLLVGDPTEEQIERAALAMIDASPDATRETVSDEELAWYLRDACAALTAAGVAPQRGDRNAG